MPEETLQFLCLNCGFPMLQRQCKVRCARCGYFEDCSDGAMDHPNIVTQNPPKDTP